MIDKRLEELKKEVYEANMRLVKENLVIFTFGNVSGIDWQKEVIAIKPSGIDYARLTPDDMVLVTLDGAVIDNKLKPSSDTKTHLKLYKSFPGIGGVVHTHSRYATAFAQAKTPIKCFGTTHADYFYGDIPCSEYIPDKDIEKDYEAETGTLIVSTFNKSNLDYNNIRACLVAGHGPFTWGNNANEAVFISKILEEIAILNFMTLQLQPDLKSIKKSLLDKHYMRKHGKNAYYGQ